MRKQFYFFLLSLALMAVSCSKNLEERLTGSWELKRSWKQQLFGRDYFSTGYENGIFTFMDNGEATFIGATDTLTGFWRSGRYNDYYYNGGTGQTENRTMKFLRISLVNFQQNKRLEWEFDDFRFRDSWQEIRAEQYSLSNDRIYEFRRKN